MGNTGGMHAPTEFWVERIDKLQAQRDKLLAALKRLRGCVTVTGYENLRWTVNAESASNAIRSADAAIQEAEDTP